MKKGKWTAVLCIAALLLGACGNRGSAETKDIGGISTGTHRVVATVNGENVYEDEFMEWVLQTMALNMGLNMSEPQNEQVVEFLEAYKSIYLVNYVETKALLQDAKRMGILIEDWQVENFVQMVMLDFEADEKEFARITKMWGFTGESLRRYVKEQLIIQELADRVTDAVAEPAASPEEYYYDNPNMFQLDETRTIRHILVETEEEALEVIGMLDGGAAFSDLVAEISLDFGSLPTGGSLGPFDSNGWFVDSDHTLVPELAAGAFAMEREGDYSRDPVKTEFGYHVIVLDQVFPPRTLSFEEVRESLVEEMLFQAKDDYFGEYFERLLESAAIVYLEDYL